ncbi:hypothetical protein HanPI659440_Chr00c20g0734611 [Helianthus annuus]|nr:hypothetical protein HanPI659440_Chr00c20g0734611 [Helianthus annuus]
MNVYLVHFVLILVYWNPITSETTPYISITTETTLLPFIILSNLLLLLIVSSLSSSSKASVLFHINFIGRFSRFHFVYAMNFEFQLRVRVTVLVIELICETE